MRPTAFFLAALAVAAAGSTPARAADTYAGDPAHSSFSFGVWHVDISEVLCRCNVFSGSFTVDKDAPAKSSFALSIKVASIDTAVKKRDDHLRGPEFFDVKAHPLMTFKSTAVKA